MVTSPMPAGPTRSVLDVISHSQPDSGSMVHSCGLNQRPPTFFELARVRDDGTKPLLSSDMLFALAIVASVQKHTTENAAQEWITTSFKFL